MATEDQVAIARRGGGQEKMSAGITLTAAGGVAVSGSFTPPTGSRVTAIKYHTAASFTGSPTNVNLTVGKAAAGTDYVAAVDIKTANAPTAATLVAIADYTNWPAATPIFATLTGVGGTMAGTGIVEIDYSPPNF